MSIRTARLGDICDINPRAPKSLADDETVSFLSMSAVAEEGFINQEQERSAGEVRKGYSFFERGDVLVAKITPCFENGKATRTNLLKYPAGFGSTEFHVLRASKEVSPDYLFYIVWNSSFREVGAKNMTGSAGQKRVPTDFIRRLEIPLPPLNEQRRIAAILDKADVLHRKRKRTLKLLDEMAQSIFLEMFGDADHNHSNLPLVDLGALIEDGPNNGLYKPSSDYGTGVPILRINNFYEGEIVDLENLRRLKVSDDELSKFEIKEKEIVINRVNSREYVGKSAIVPQLTERTVYESNMMRFRVRRDIFMPEYCIHSLQTAAVRRQIQSKTKDAINQSSINQKDVRALRVLLPPIDEQRRFSRARDKLFSMRIGRRIDAVGAQNLFASLQHRAFAGQL